MEFLCFLQNMKKVAPCPPSPFLHHVQQPQTMSNIFFSLCWVCWSHLKYPPFQSISWSYVHHDKLWRARGAFPHAIRCKKYTQGRRTQTQKMHQVSVYPPVLNCPVKETFWFSNPFLIFFFFFIPPLLPLFWEMRKIYKSKLLIKHLLCPWDRGPSLLFRWHVYCWHLSFLWVCTEPWNPFTFLIRLFLFFNLVQENRICNMHNTLKNCSIRGKALPMFLAVCTSKRHSVKKNSNRGLRKVLTFCILGQVCLR